MNRRQIFNKVKKHLLTQNAKSKSGGICQYQYRELKCAIGCLIPDKYYRSYFEGHSIMHYLPLQTTLASILGEPLDLGFLQELQEIHDRSKVEEWPNKLDEFEERWLGMPQTPE